MPFIVPNATDTTGGNKYVALDQAEPDSLDFEVLGNGLSGVISGGAVTAIANTPSTVRVEAATVVIDGLYYSVPGSDAFSLTSAPSDKRFDLVVARKSGSTASYVCLSGGDSATNPTFPRSNSNVVTSNSGYFNPSTDVLIAAVYRSGGTVNSGNIVDKRKFVITATPYRGTVAPSDSQGTVGDIYVKTGSVASGESGVYVKRSASGDWTQLAPAFTNPGVPIGTVIMWPSPTPPDSSVWVFCGGQAVAKSGQYSQLYAVIADTFGASGSNFNLPDYRGMYMVGASSSAPTASTLLNPVGNISNQVTLTANNVPSHTHPIDHAHTGTAAANGAHTHQPPDSQNYDFALRRDGSYAPGHYVAPHDVDGSGYASRYQYTPGDNVTYLPGMSTWHSATTGESTTHTHDVSITATSGMTSGAGGQTSPTAVSIQPRSMRVAFYIRYA